ncbi:MAG: hypothetical protein ACREIC_26350, partial [Limisphaerales bacterium]
ANCVTLMSKTRADSVKLFSLLSGLFDLLIFRELVIGSGRSSVVLLSNLGRCLLGPSTLEGCQHDMNDPFDTRTSPE